MIKTQTYHRPQSVDEVIELIQRPETAVLAGGTQLVANRQEIGAFVDLQDVGLDGITANANGSLTFGAMVRVQDVVDHPSVPDLVRQMAHREGPNTFRHAGTLGGVLALADWESELYAALLLFEAVVTVQSAAGEQTVPLAEFELADGMLITAVTIQTSGKTAAERVARTPADNPIVAVLGRQSGEAISFAACGVAAKPILLAEADMANLQPPDDFRGSTGYRLEMVKLLMQRVFNEIEITQRR